MSCTSVSIRAEPVVPEDRDLLEREVVLREEPVAHGVVDVVVDVGDPVDETNDLPLERLGLALAGVREDAVAHLVREVERPRDPERLLVVSEAASEPLLRSLVERVLAGMPERRMPHVVPEPDRLSQILVEAERPGDDTRDRSRLERVSHARAVVISLRIDEDLRLPLQPSERLRVDDAVPVALELRPHAARLLRPLPPERVGRTHGERREARLERTDSRLKRHAAQMMIGTVPPSALHAAPVTYDARSEQRNTMTEAISSGRASRPSGRPAPTFASTSSRSPCCSASPP